MHKKYYYFNYLAALFTLTVLGIGYRAIARYLKVFEQTPVKLPCRLFEFPMQVGDWRGKDIDVPYGILKVARNDDYLYRQYINEQSRETINLYIAYTARPGNMLGHNPQMCYEGNGWIHDGTEKSAFVASSGKEVPCLIHHFHKPSPSDETVIVLNYYVINGRLSRDERMFSGIRWRSPNIRRDASRYVAQVQISSTLESAVRKAAMEITGVVLMFLPDVNGRVEVSKILNVPRGNEK